MVSNLVTACVPRVSSGRHAGASDRRPRQRRPPRPSQSAAAARRLPSSRPQARPSVAPSAPTASAGRVADVLRADPAERRRRDVASTGRRRRCAAAARRVQPASEQGTRCPVRDEVQRDPSRGEDEQPSGRRQTSAPAPSARGQHAGVRRRAEEPAQARRRQGRPNGSRCDDDADEPTAAPVDTAGQARTAAGSARRRPVAPAADRGQQQDRRVGAVVEQPGARTAQRRAARPASAARPRSPLPRQRRGSLAGPSARTASSVQTGDGVELRLHRLALGSVTARCSQSVATTLGLDLRVRRRRHRGETRARRLVTPADAGPASSARASPPRPDAGLARGPARPAPARRRRRPGGPGAKHCSTRPGEPLVGVDGDTRDERGASRRRRRAAATKAATRAGLRTVVEHAAPRAGPDCFVGRPAPGAGRTRAGRRATAGTATGSSRTAARARSAGRRRGRARWLGHAPGRHRAGRSPSAGVTASTRPRETRRPPVRGQPGRVR